jgi:hypothetical protein
MLRRLTSIPLRLLGNAITVEQSLINYLRENISGVAIIDMDGDDYELNRTQAAKSILLVVDSGDGTKVINYNSADADIIPTNVFIIGLYSNGFIVKYSGNATAATIEKAGSTQIAIIPSASAAVSFSYFYSDFANRHYNSRREMADITEDFSRAGYAGILVVTTNPLATVITVKDQSNTDSQPREKGIIRCANAAGLTIQGDTGILINGTSAGSFVMVKDQIAHWFYNSANDSYEIG